VTDDDDDGTPGDADGDGWTVEDGDCDDSDPQTYPGATENCADGEDGDCDGLVDEADADCECEELRLYVGDITITSESAGEAFCDEYNGLVGSIVVDSSTMESAGSLACLCEVGGNLDLAAASALEAAEFPYLQSIGGDFVIEDNDDLLLTLLSAPNLSVVGGDLLVRYGASLLVNYNLANLEEVGGTIWIQETAVDTLTFDALETVGGDFHLYHNDSATRVEAPELKSVGGEFFLWIHEKAEIIDFPSLATVSGDFRMGYSSLAEVEFESLTEIGGRFGLNCCVGSSIDFPSLETVGWIGLLNLSTGDQLLLLPSLRVIRGQFRIEDMWVSQEIYLPELVSIHGDVVWGGDYGAQPVPIVDMPKLEEVSGDINVGGCTELQETDWTSLAAVQGDLMLYSNLALVDISGLFNIEYVAGDLYIVSNPILPTSQAEELVSQVGEDNIGGEITITGNAT